MSETRSLSLPKYGGLTNHSNISRDQNGVMMSFSATLKLMLSDAPSYGARRIATLCMSVNTAVLQRQIYSKMQTQMESLKFKENPLKI